VRPWLDRQFIDRLGQMRPGPSESYSDVILRLARPWTRSGDEDRAYGFEHDDVMGFRAAQGRIDSNETLMEIYVAA